MLHQGSGEEPNRGVSYKQTPGSCFFLLSSKLLEPLRQAELSWPGLRGKHPGNIDKELLPQGAQLQLFLNSEVMGLSFFKM